MINVNKILSSINGNYETPKQIIAVIADLQICDTNELNLLRIPVKCGIADKIYKQNELTISDVNRYTLILTNDFFMQQEFAEEAIYAWAALLGKKVKGKKNRSTAITKNNDSKQQVDHITGNDNDSITSKIYNWASSLGKNITKKNSISSTKAKNSDSNRQQVNNITSNENTVCNDSAFSNDSTSFESSDELVINGNLNTELVKKIKHGDVIKFGKWYLNFYFKRDEVPMKWIALTMKDNKLLLLSACSIEDYDTIFKYRGDNDYSDEWTYRGSILDKWNRLDRVVFNNAFSPEERKFICKTRISNGNNPILKHNKKMILRRCLIEDDVFVFMPSMEEVEKYVQGEPFETCYILNERWIGTNPWLLRTAGKLEYDDDEDEGYFCKTTFVDGNGHIDYYGGTSRACGELTIRIGIWLDISSVITAPKSKYDNDSSTLYNQTSQNSIWNKVKHLF